MDLKMGLAFDQKNPKRGDTPVYKLYDEFKEAITVVEALELGATKGFI